MSETASSSGLIWVCYAVSLSVHLEKSIYYSFKRDFQKPAKQPTKRPNFRQKKVFCNQWNQFVATHWVVPRLAIFQLYFDGFGLMRRVRFYHKPIRLTVDAKQRRKHANINKRKWVTIVD